MRFKINQQCGIGYSGMRFFQPIVFNAIYLLSNLIGVKIKSQKNVIFLT